MTLGDLSKDYNLIEFEDYADGDIIFNEGTPGDWIYVVIKGEVEIFKNIRGKKVVVDSLKEGDLFGEISFVDKNPRSAGARAVGDKVTLGLFDKDFLAQEYNKLPSNFRVIFDAMARRLRKMTAVAVNLAGRKNDRVSSTIDVKFKTPDELFDAFATNIGGGGLFISTDKVLEAGLEVNLKFNLPGDNYTINAKGKICRKAAGAREGLGVQFISLSPEDKERLSTFLKKKKG